MQQRAQTSVEYLIIIAIVLIVSAAVIATLRGSITINAGSKPTSSQVTSAAGVIGILDVSATPVQTVFYLRNNAQSDILITSTTINGLSCLMTQSVRISRDGYGTVFCVPESSSLTVGSISDIIPAFSYTDLATAATYSFSPQTRLQVQIGTGGPTPETLFDGIVGLWHFDDAYVADATGHGFDGTFVNNAAISSAGKIGSAANFTGVDSDNYITVPDNTGLRIRGNFTILAWAKINDCSANGNWPAIIDKITDSPHSGYALWTTSTYGPCYVVGAIGNGTWHYHDNPFAATLGQWYFYAVTYNGSNLTLYVNGTLVDSKIVPPPVANTADLRINRGFTSTSGNDALIDEVSIWNTTLTAANISYYYNAGAGRAVTGTETGLVAAYHLDDDLLSNSTTITLDDVTAATNDINFNFGLGGNTWNYGYSFTYEVYAYKDVNGIRYFSNNMWSFYGYDGGGDSDFYTTDLSWDSVAGADGYRLIVYDDWYGAFGDYYLDTSNNYVTIDGDCDTNTWNCYSSGNTVTPKAGVITATSTRDMSGKNKHAQFSGTITSRPGKFNRAFNFTGGSNAGLLITDILPVAGNNQNYSFAAWVKQATASTSDQAIYIAGTNDLGCPYGGYNSGLFTVNSGTKWGGYIDKTWVSNAIASTNAFSAGVWTHVTVTYKDNNITLYKNGEHMSSAKYASIYQYAASPISGAIGAHLDCDGNPIMTFNGLLDDVAIWNRTLTPLEVAQLYNLGAAIPDP